MLLAETLRTQKSPRTSHSSSNKIYAYQNIHFVVLVWIDYFCNQQMPYQKTQYQDECIQYDTRTGPAIHPKPYDNHF